jgi:hypothetical protein
MTLTFMPRDHSFWTLTFADWILCALREKFSVKHQRGNGHQGR